MANWKKKRIQDKVEQNRNTSSDNDALDRLVNLKKGIYAYKIFNNSNRPLIGNDGASNVILYDRTFIENIVFTVSETKTKVQEVTRGEISEGKNIIKYKTLTLLNVDKPLEEYDIFSESPIGEGIYDRSNLNVFAYEEETGTYEREEISQNISKIGQSVHLITINALDIYREQSIYFENYDKMENIPQLKKGYKVNQIKYDLPVGVGVIYNSVRAISNGLEEDIDLYLDEVNTTAKMFVSKFSMINNFRSDIREEYSNPMNQLNIEEAQKYLTNKNIVDTIGSDTEDKKSILNLICGLLTINYFQNRRYQGLIRDAQGNITDAIRGFSMSDADKFENSEINDNFIRYWLENITSDEYKILAYGYIAMLSDYIESSYSFKKEQNKYGQLYRFKATFSYDEKLKEINNFDTPINILLISNIYKIQNNNNAIEIIDIEDQFKNISKSKLSSDILGITYGEATDILQANNLSNYIGDNKPSEDAKYFALQAAADYTKLLNKYKPLQNIIKHVNDKEIRKRIKSYSQQEVYDITKNLPNIPTNTYGYFGWTLNQNIDPRLVLIMGINPEYGFLEAIKWILKEYDLFLNAVPESNFYKLSKTISSTAYVIDNTDGEKYEVGNDARLKLLADKLAASFRNQKHRILTFYKEIEYEVIYTQDILSNIYNGIISEQEYYDNQNELNTSDIYTLAVNFSPKHKETITSIVSIDLITKGGGNITYIKDFEYEENGKIVKKEKRYHYTLPATHSFKQALFKIYDN